MRGGFRGSVIGNSVGTIAGSVIGFAGTVLRQEPIEDDAYVPEVREVRVQKYKKQPVQQPVSQLKLRRIRFIDDNRSHVIDAGENSERVYTDFKHYEVAKYYSYTKHIVHPDVVIASTNFLDSMSAADKEIFDKLVADSTDYEFDAFAESVQEAKKDAEANGAIFVYPDTELFREKCQPLLDSISGQSEVTKKIYDKVQALREEK